VPPLVAQILGKEFRCLVKTWKDIRVRGGFAKKATYALAQAADAGANAAVITGDRDKGERRELLRSFLSARNHARNSYGLHAAVGVADPHGEAWLLDDPHAVRSALSLPADTEIPEVSDGYPKDLLQSLINDSGRSDDSTFDVLHDIAVDVRLDRMRSASDTGFRDFVQDVENELRHL